MNPMVVAAASQAVESGQAKELIVEARKPAMSAAVIILVIAVLVVGVFMYKKWKKAADKERFNEVDTDTKNESGVKNSLAKTYANRINAAFSWYNDDEEEIYAVGRDMKTNGVSFSLVAKAFKAGFQKDLAATLSDKLNATELKKFYQAAGLAGLNGLGQIKLFSKDKSFIKYL